MKGGVGASYTKGCPLPELIDWSKVISYPEIKIRYFKKTNQTYYLRKSDNYDKFCSFLDAKNLGIKLFRNMEEFTEEYDKIRVLVNHFDLDFIDKYTCIAVDIDKSISFLDVASTNLMVFKNSNGNLHDMKYIIKLDPLFAFRQIYSKCFEFLLTLHKHDVGYRDFKIENILLNIEDNKSLNIIIGDMGSLQFFSKSILDNLQNSGKDYSTDEKDKIFTSIKKHNYTFMDPVNSDFVDFWRKKKWKFIQSLKTTLFSKDNLEKVYNDWNSIGPDKRKYPDQNQEYENEPYDDSINEYTSEYTEAVENLYRFAIDWFHFGVCMIQLIMKINEEKQLIDDKYIDTIWEFFCATPMLFDKNYTFDMLFTCSSLENNAKSKVANNASGKPRQTRSAIN